MTDTPGRIVNAITATFGFHPNELRPDQRLVEDLHFDSLDMVELAMALEEEFGIDIPDDIWDSAGDRTLAQVAALIDGRREAQGRSA